MGSNVMVMGEEFPIFLHRRRGNCSPVDGVACSTAFLTLEEGIDLYNNQVARKASESTGNMDASSLSSDAALISLIKAW